MFDALTQTVNLPLWMIFILAGYKPERIAKYASRVRETFGPEKNK